MDLEQGGKGGGMDELPDAFLRTARAFSRESTRDRAASSSEETHPGSSEVIVAGEVKA